ncbi:MAG: hypothetical protein IKW97_01300 [Muribaculaceae bacterium]|nr:hypothetical protein [Muribaculaceae bacterium]
MDQNNYDNLNGVGKRMPYNVPVDFFAKLEENVMREVKAEMAQPVATPRPRAWLSKGFTRFSIAAAAALAVVVGYHALQSQRADNFTAVEEAFANLNEEDQEYLLEVYQEDVFMDEDADELDI